MSDSQRQPQPPMNDRLPGRSFSDPRRPLGDDVIARANPGLGTDPEGGVYGRADDVNANTHTVPERAKCVAVLRKAEELMATGNPSGETEDGRRRAIELACGRCGVKVDEYYRLRDGDEEIIALETAVMESAIHRHTKL